jgi:signal transduction histidine kinase
MTLKIGVKKALGWFGTLSGRLTILLTVSLAITQATTLAYLVEKHERERALGVDRAFFATLARASQTLANLPREERSRVLRSMDSGGLSYWVAPGPSLGPDETTLAPESPPLPEAWGLISSDDKRASWYPDLRPLSMKYRVNTPPGPAAGRIEDVDMPADFDGPAPSAEIETSGPGMRLTNLDDLAPGRAKPNPVKDAAFEPDPGRLPLESTFESREPGARGEKPRPPGEPNRGGPPRDRSRSFGAVDASGKPLAEWQLVRGDPAYGDAAARRPSASPGSPPVRWRAAVLLPDGEWLNGEYNQMGGLPAFVEVLFQQNLVVLLVACTIIIVGVGLTTQRLTALSRAADRVGRGDTLEPIRESGTSEVRGLTQSFNTMSLRLRRFIEGRTQMLGAISHDLRTPITGLRLRAELVDDEENRERMLAIIDELHHLTEATLALAREDSISERTDRVDLSSLVESIVDDLTDVGMDVSCTVERGVTGTCRPFSLRRAIRNLAENGVKYGKRSRVALTTTEKFVRIIIDDDGPGIPEDQLEKALLPFVRLEGSRSRETGGAGLGLAITRSIVLNHGGELRLSNRGVGGQAGGGLRAEILLPKDA